MSGRLDRSASASRAISAASPASSRVCDISPDSSSRCESDQRVDELLQIGRLVREQVTELRHEVVEVLLGVRALGIGVEHRVEPGHHVLDPLHRLRVGLLQGLLHAAELAVEHLPAEQVLQLLERFPGGGRAPLVVGEIPDRLRHVGRQRVKLGLAQPGIVTGIREQLGALLADRRVEQRPGLLQDAVEPAGVPDLALPFPDPPEQVVESLMAGHPPAHQIAQRAGRIRPVQHRLAQRVHGAADVVGRL
jgi:hypothetical protein